MATVAQPQKQYVVKLSKLIKKARQLGCETFSKIADVVATKNWLKRVFDTLKDMEIEDDFKLKGTFRLIDKSAVTWWDNVKLRSAAPVTWDLFV